MIFFLLLGGASAFSISFLKSATSSCRYSAANFRAKSGALPAGKPAVSTLPGLPRMSRHMCSHVCGQIGVSSRVATCAELCKSSFGT